MNNTGDGEESTPPQVAIQPRNEWAFCLAFALLPDPVSSLVLVLPLISHTLVPEHSQASWMESQKLIPCLRIPHGKQTKQMDGSGCKRAENCDNG